MCILPSFVQLRASLWHEETSTEHFISSFPKKNKKQTSSFEKKKKKKNTDRTPVLDLKIRPEVCHKIRWW